MPGTEPTVSQSLTLILDEVHQLLNRLQAEQPTALEQVAAALSEASTVFVHGAGRSGVAVRALAMRLMHLGLTVHVVGETTTPAIAEGDVLLAVSGSGTTVSVVRSAETAVSVGARVVAVTNEASSPLAQAASLTLLVGAASKTDRSGTASAQYAGSLFEQSVLLIGDALFHTVWQRSGQSAEALWPRHANLE
ncbi:MAG: 6-phospho-3-hexuloisomerase [Alphaproteobacteria bacterium]|nr:MAG: 6-phospho-3-hexuloisomerase [Alphaproteobacteria bacterium]